MTFVFAKTLQIINNTPVKVHLCQFRVVAIIFRASKKDFLFLYFEKRKTKKKSYEKI